MKNVFLLLATVSVATTAMGQSLTPANGFTSSELFNLGSGYTISALGASSGGDIFYLASGDFGSGPTTELFRRTAASGYSSASQTAIFDFGSKLVGSFVKVSGSTVYFGESDLGSIHSISISGSAASHQSIGNIENHYDLAVNGSDLFVSANPGYAGNKVFRLVLSGAGALQQLDTIIDTGGDNSGPITFDAGGNLLYGATGDIPAFMYDAPLPAHQKGGVFSFSNISGAIDSNPAAEDRTIALSSGSKIFSRGSNQAFSTLGLDLFQTDGTDSFSDGSSKLFDLRVGQPATLVGSTGAGEFFGGLSSSDTAVFATVTSTYANGPSAVFRVVPEPCSALLAALGGFSWLGFRRSRAARAA